MENNNTTDTSKTLGQVKLAIETILKINKERNLQDWKDHLLPLLPKPVDLEGKSYEESHAIVLEAIKDEEIDQDTEDAISNGGHLQYVNLTRDDLTYLSKKFGISDTWIMELEQDVLVSMQK